MDTPPEGNETHRLHQHLADGEFWPRVWQVKAPVTAINTLSRCCEEIRTHFKPQPLCASTQHYTKIRLQILFYWSDLEKPTSSIVLTDKNLLVTLVSEACTSTGEAFPKSVHMPLASHSFTPLHLHAAQERGKSKFWVMAHSDEFDVSWTEITMFFGTWQAAIE